MIEFADSISKKVYEDYLESVVDQNDFLDKMLIDKTVPLNLIRNQAFFVCYNPKGKRLYVISKSDYCGFFHYNTHEIEIKNPPVIKDFHNQDEYQFVILNNEQMKNLWSAEDIILFDNSHGNGRNEGCTISNELLRFILNCNRNQTYEFRFYPKSGKMLVCIFMDKIEGMATKVYKVYTREGYTLEKYEQLLREIGYNI